MSFIDEAKIHVKGGSGGRGCISFRREKYIEFGGPDGGNGGNGGSVVFVATSDLNTLLYFRYHQHISAKNGRPGAGRNKSGASGGDLIIKVPIGTQVYEEDGTTLICDLSGINQQYVIASGGKGGIGNTQYKSSTNRAPTDFTYGLPGEERCVILRLKIISDVGIVGMPNAGKSSLLSKCTMSKTKVSNYPFTTLEPHLGVAYLDTDRSIVLADIPGIIENANLGAGLGHKFLKHIERCSVLLHLIDSSAEDVISVYRLVRRELELYNKSLILKKEIVVLNKCDLITEEKISEKKSLLEEFCKKEIITLSIHSDLGQLLNILFAETRQTSKGTIPKFDPFLYVNSKKGNR